LLRHTGSINPTQDYFFNTLELARQLHQLFSQLKVGVKAAQLDLPSYADEATYQALLQRLIRNWGHIPTRHFNRRGGTRDEAELCTGIRTIHTLLLAAQTPHATGSPSPSPDEISISTISVLNRNNRRRSHRYALENSQ
jgi:hypothetical protein